MLANSAPVFAFSQASKNSTKTSFRTCNHPGTSSNKISIAVLLAISISLAFHGTALTTPKNFLRQSQNDCPSDSITSVSLKDGDTQLNIFNRPSHEEFADSMIVQIPKAGIYQVVGLVNFDSGNRQLNESLYLFVRNQNDNNRITYPLDPNTSLPGNIQFRVVKDDTIDSDHSTYRHLGYFHFKAGIDTIIVYHYGRISAQDPTFLNCGQPGPPEDTTNCRLVNGKKVMRDYQSVHVKAFVLTFAGSDLQIDQTAIADTSILIGGMRFPAVLAGSPFPYKLKAKNNSLNSAENFTVADTIPDILVPDFGNRQPSSRAHQGQDSIFVWSFDSLSAGAEDSIVFVVSTPTTLDSFPFPLFSASQIVASCDTIPENNFSSILVYVIEPPVAIFDLAHSQAASVDTVVAGESFSYQLTVANTGDVRAGNFTVSDTLPAFLTPEFIQRLPNTRLLVGTDSVFVWQFDQPGDSLAVGDSVSVDFTVAVPADLAPLPQQIFNASQVTHPDDVDTSNNFGTSSVTVVAPPQVAVVDLAHSQAASVDTVVAGGSFSYQLTVANTGDVRAGNFTVSDTLPAFLTPDFSQRLPNQRLLVGTDSMFVWQFDQPGDSLAVGDSVSVDFTVAVPADLDPLPQPIFSSSQVEHPDDADASNDFGSSIVTVVAPPQVAVVDLAHSQAASVDSVVAGGSFSYSLKIINTGELNAGNFTISDTLPAFLTPDFSQRLPNQRLLVGTDSVFVWQFDQPGDSLAVGDSVSVDFTVAVPADLAPLPQPVFSSSQVEHPDDADASNDFGSSIVTVVAPPQVAVVDLAHSQAASVDSVVAGESFSYQLTVANTGDVRAGNFTVSDTLPAFFTPDFIQRLPNQRLLVGTDSVFVWQFDQPGDSLAVGDSVSVDFTVAVPADLAPLPQPVFSSSQVNHSEDTDASNNFGSSQVTAIAQARSVLECYLDRNVFEPNLEPMLGVNLGLTTSSRVEINVHDLSGTLIKRLANRDFGAGQHRVAWNGMAENGQRAGSGFYLITVRSPEIIFYKKFFLIR